jgi:hypothetical protein
MIDMNPPPCYLKPIFLPLLVYNTLPSQDGTLLVGHRLSDEKEACRNGHGEIRVKRYFGI